MKRWQQFRAPRPSGRCDRVVLDANCLRGAKASELQALRDQGFSTAVSLDGLREFWCQTIRDDAYEMLVARLRKVSPFVDAEHPLAFAGQALFARIGRVPADVLPRAKQFREHVGAGWRAACSGDIDRDRWKSVGDELQAELEREKDGWRRLIAIAERIEDSVESVELRRRALLRAMTSSVPGETTPAFPTRAEAYFSYMAEKFISVRRARPAMNDYIDSRMLQVLSEPAFLVTKDARLLDTVVRTSRTQSAWVRTPAELALDLVVRAVPWGQRAREVSSLFRPESADVRLQRQRGWEEDLAGRPVETVPPIVPEDVQ
jgi:hypothetical protein